MVSCCFSLAWPRTLAHLSRWLSQALESSHRVMAACSPASVGQPQGVSTRLLVCRWTSGQRIATGRRTTGTLSQTSIQGVHTQLCQLIFTHSGGTLFNFLQNVPSVTDRTSCKKLKSVPPLCVTSSECRALFRVENLHLSADLYDMQFNLRQIANECRNCACSCAVR